MRLDTVVYININGYTFIESTLVFSFFETRGSILKKKKEEKNLFLESQFFLLTTDLFYLFWKRFVFHTSKQEVTKVVSLLKMAKTW